MKSRLALMTLLMSFAASAQVDDSENFFIFLSIIASPENKGVFLPETRISDAGAEALVQYARQGVDEANRLGLASAQGLCLGKQALHDPEALARRLEADDAQQRALWRSLEQNITNVLTPEDEAKLRSWFKREWHPTVSPPIDISQAIRSGRIQPDDILARACDGLDAAAQSPPIAENKGPPPAPVKRMSVPVSAVAPPAGPPPALMALPKPSGYSQCEAWAINNAGVIVGYCWNEDPAFSVAVRWDHDAAQVLEGPLRSAEASAGDLPVAGAMAVGINDAGTIVGSLFVGSGTRLRTRAAIWSEGYWRDLGLPQGSGGLSARGINSRGDVVGAASGHAAVFWHDEGTFELLTPLKDGWDCRALAINARGQAVGQCFDTEKATGVAVMWDDHEAVELVSPCTMGDQTIAYARTITDSGLIGGTAGTCAVLWNVSTPDKPAVVAEEGVVNSINRSGELVGNIGNGKVSTPRVPGFNPAKWGNRSTAALDAKPTEAAAGNARFINDRGAFVGSIVPSGGGSYAFVSR